MLVRFFCLALILQAAVALKGQTTSLVIITPEKATILVGDSQVFRLVDQDGKMQHNVSWTLSDPGAFAYTKADELTVTAKRTGDFRISASSRGGSAEATLKVMEGHTLPQGTVKWEAGTIPGCKTTKLLPAVPSPSGGADVFEQSQCADGQYVAAYTADGIMMWRVKRGGVAPGRTSQSVNEAPTAHVNTNASSVCDAIVVGSDQRTVRDLLAQSDLSFRQGPATERVWVIEQANVDCKVWFDDKGLVAKKRKIFVSQ